MKLSDSIDKDVGFNNLLNYYESDEKGYISWYKTYVSKKQVNLEDDKYKCREKLGLQCCKISEYSLDYKRRPQIDCRINRSRAKVFHYHATFIYKYFNKQFYEKYINKIGPNHLADDDLCYSHLCHNKRCVEPTHGILESRKMNSSRNICANAALSFIVKKRKGKYILSRLVKNCQHKPSCITFQVRRNRDTKKFVLNQDN